MACSGGHCSYHDTGTTTCVGHRPPCATNRYFIPSAEFAVQGGDITAADVEQLRSKLRAELAAYNVNYLYSYTLYQPSSYVSGQNAEDPHVEELRLMAIQVAGGAPYTDRNGLPIEDTDWGTGIATLYETIRTNCICNTDCSCNAICACHNDCGCNYSDENVKVDIKYL